MGAEREVLRLRIGQAARRSSFSFRCVMECFIYHAHTSYALPGPKSSPVWSVDTFSK